MLVNVFRTIEAIEEEAAPPIRKPALAFVRSGRSWAVAGALGLAAALILAVRMPWQTGSSEGIDRLVAATGSERTIRGRLSGGFPYANLRSPSRSSPGTVSNLALMAEAGRAQKIAQADPTPENLHVYGVASLLLSDYDEAITNLQAAADQRPDDADLLNDLAVTYGERAARMNRAADYPRALEYAERAAQLQPQLAEAVHSRAAALDGMGLRDRAIDAWREYLRLDSTSGWAAEARTRLANLEAAPPQSRWSDHGGLLTNDNLDDANLAALARDIPDVVPEALLGGVLQRWTVDQRPETLRLARRLSAAFANATGDHSLTHAIEPLSSETAGRSLAAIGELATGFQLLGRDRYVDAEPHLLSAVSTLGNERRLLRDWAMFGLGRVRYFRGAAEQSARDFDAVIASSRSYGAAALEARALWLRGIVRFTQGDWAASRADYDNAIRVFEAIRDAQGVATVHVNLSILFRFLGERELVWQHRMVALRHMPVHRPDLAHGFLITTAVTASLEQLDRVGLLFLDEAVKNSEQALPPYTRAESLVQRAKAFARLGQRAEAERDLGAAQSAWGEVTDDAVRSRVQLSLLTAAAQVHADTNPSVAVDEARQAITSATARRDLLRSAELHLYLAQALSKQDRYEQAREAIRAGIRDFQSARASLPVTDPTRLAAFEPVWELFDEAFALHLQSASIDRAAAFQDYETSRAQTLLELRSEAQGTFDSVRRALGDRQTLALMHQQEQSLVVWVIDRDNDHFARIPVSSAAALRMTSDYRWRLANGTSVDDISRRLYSTILAPILETIAPGRAVIIIPDQPFLGTPWAALVDPATNEPVLTRWAISEAPSATLAVARPGSLGAHPAHALIVSAPENSDGMPLLTGARDEARSISALYPMSTLMEGREASVDRVSAAMPANAVIHISAHALNNPVYPLLSRLVLPSSAPDIDGLTVRDVISGPRLARGTLVVLAACRTMGPTARRGEGAVGLAWGFLAAGAAAVVATLWDVDDVAVAPLFVDFHRRLVAGQAPGEALRATQRQAWERGDDQRTWASLQLVGRP